MGWTCPKDYKDLNSFGHNTRNFIYCYYKPTVQHLPSPTALFFLCSHAGEAWLFLHSLHFDCYVCALFIILIRFVCFLFDCKLFIVVNNNCLKTVFISLLMLFLYSLLLLLCCLFCCEYFMQYFIKHSRMVLPHSLPYIPVLALSVYLAHSFVVSVFSCWCSIFFHFFCFNVIN